MTTTTEAFNQFTELAPCRLVANTAQSGTYNNGPLNNGVGATFTYATGALTIDSVTVLLGDYILFAAQSAQYQNGIYQCTVAGATGVSAVLTRRGDFQSIEQIQLGGFVPVYAGTVYAGAVFQVVEPLPAAIGVPVTSGANNINFATITAAASSLYLAVANNLNDVNSASTSLANLGGLPLIGANTTAGAPGFPVVVKTTTVGQAALATGGSVSLLPSSSTHQYHILNIILDNGGTNFSGGGGDRLGQVTDGTTVYSVIPAATMQTLTNSVWGSTAVAAPASAKYSALTAAGAAVTFKYSGGTTDYTAGSLTITVVAVQVA